MDKKGGGAQMRNIDKLSAALIAGIIALTVISGTIVYKTWIDPKKSDNDFMTASAERDIENRELTFNDDTSITNNSSRKLWLRVKVVYYESYRHEGYEIVSEAMDDGYWIQGNDEWYYCSVPVDFAESTEPLIDQLLYGDRNVMGDDSKKFRLQAEAIDEAWLPVKPESGKEAFKLFTEACESETHTYL